MSKFLFVLFILVTSAGFCQEQDSIFRIMFLDAEREMLFGSSVKIHDSVIELTDFNTGKSIYVKKEEIDYVKTPYGYLTFNPKIRKVGLSGNRSIRVLLAAGTGISGQYSYLGDTYKDNFNGAGALEIDFNPWIGPRKPRFLDWRVGLGVEYQVPRKIKNINGKVSFISLFGLTKFYFMDDEDISPGIFGRYGMNYFRSTSDFPGYEHLSGSYYFSAGLLISFNKRIEFRGAYTVNKGYINLNQVLNVVKYQTVDFTLAIVIR